jgi:mono/diheme cytochrome c family protein
LTLLALLLTASFAAGAARADSAPDPAAVKRGAYVFAVAGCAACHTDRKNKGALLAGGPGLETPFGTFYAPNITPDPTHGIGGWTDAEFVRALREGPAGGRGASFPSPILPSP